MTEDELDVLLVEDNPGDARLIEEMIRDAEDLLQRVDLGGAAANGSEVYHEDRLADGLERASEIDADVILLDLGLPDSTGLDTLASAVDATEWTPIVVLTGLRDEQLGIEAIQRGAQDYLVKDEVTSDLLVRSIHHALERNRQERERARRREQLEALNSLNRIGQEVTHAVITTSTREELEQAVCDNLAASDAYRFAWIGEVDRGTDRIRPRVAAGVEEGYLDEIEITVDEDERSRGPAGRAVETQSVQVMQDIRNDPAFEPWRDQALERGYRSSAAVPIVYEGLLYGVLNIYADSASAFSEPETEILSRLGDVIGHAIAAIERKDALVSDTALELEFEVSGVARPVVALSTERDCAVEIDNVVQRDDALIAYGQAAGVSDEAFREATEEMPSVEDLRVLTSSDEECEFEVVTSMGASLVEVVATHGGRVKSATIEGGSFRVLMEFPRGRDKRQLIELVQDQCPDAEPVAQRTVERADGAVSISNSILESRLTEKQRTALETAYFAGHFDWPRKSTGEEVAERLGISAPTLAQHLRTAERKFFEAVFEAD